MKIVTVIGARPQFIKASMLSHTLSKASKCCEVIIHTGQHYDSDMSDIFFEELKIPKPAYQLQIAGNSHGAMTGNMIAQIEEVLLKEKPGIVLVYGDTNSTLAGALSAVKLHIPVAHVEAGLRSFNRKMPEEINRILTDQCSSFLFSPTQRAATQLIKEGFSPSQIHEVGDIMFDCALRFSDQSSILDQLKLSPKEYVLATLHRAENTDDPVRLKGYFAGLEEISREIPVVMPLHPRTQKALNLAGLRPAQTLQIIPPIGYLDMLALEKGAKTILTDSGGVQKEAYFFQVPCLTLRDETEWVELVESGANRLVPPNPQEIVASYRNIQDIDWVPGLYGDGKASEKISRVLYTIFNTVNYNNY